MYMPVCAMLVKWYRVMNASKTVHHIVIYTADPLFIDSCEMVLCGECI